MKNKTEFYFRISSDKKKKYRLACRVFLLSLSILELPLSLGAAESIKIGCGTMERWGNTLNFDIYSSTNVVKGYESRLKDLLPDCHFNVDSYQSTLIPQKAITIVNENQVCSISHGLLYTNKVNTCRAVSLYYPPIKVGILAHFSTTKKYEFDDVQSLERLCKHYSNIQGKDVNLTQLEEILEEEEESEEKTIKYFFEKIESQFMTKLDLSQFQVTVVCGHLTEDLLSTCSMLVRMGLKIINVYYNPVVAIRLKWDECRFYYDLNRLTYNAQMNAYVLLNTNKEHWCKSLTLDADTGNFWVDANFFEKNEIT